MKVLAVTETIWPIDYSGGSIATYLHLKKLAEEGAEVTVIGPVAPPNVKLIKVQLPVNRPMLWFYIIKKRELFYKLVRQHDVVYIPRYAYPMVDIAQMAGIPVIIHMHGYPTYKSLGILGDWKLEKSYRLLYAALVHRTIEKAIDHWLRHANVILCVSKTHCQKLARYRPVYLANPPPDDLLPPQFPRRYFIYLGGEQRHKCYKLAYVTARTVGMPLLSPKNISRLKVIQLLARAWALLFPSCW